MRMRPCGSAFPIWGTGTAPGPAAASRPEVGFHDVVKRLELRIDRQPDLADAPELATATAERDGPVIAARRRQLAVMIGAVVRYQPLAGCS